MKKLLTAAAAFAALTFATPAQAYVSQADIEATRAIVQKLRATGVTVTTPSSCPGGQAGLYSFSTSTLTICPLAMQSRELFVETIAHEAVHAAQHCVNGPLIATVRKDRVGVWAKNIANGLLYKWDHVKAHTKHLDADARAIEYEAYSLEASPATVLAILKKACG